MFAIHVKKYDKSFEYIETNFLNNVQSSLKWINSQSLTVTPMINAFQSIIVHTVYSIYPTKVKPVIQIKRIFDQHFPYSVKKQ